MSGYPGARQEVPRICDIRRADAVMTSKHTSTTGEVPTAHSAVRQDVLASDLRPAWASYTVAGGGIANGADIVPSCGFILARTRESADNP